MACNLIEGMIQKILQTTIFVWEGAYSTKIDLLSLLPSCTRGNMGPDFDQYSFGMALNIAKDDRLTCNKLKYTIKSSWRHGIRSFVGDRWSRGVCFFFLGCPHTKPPPYPSGSLHVYLLGLGLMLGRRKENQSRSIKSTAHECKKEG